MKYRTIGGFTATLLTMGALTSAKPASANSGTFIVYSNNANSPMPPDVDSSSYCSLRSATIAIANNLSTWHGCTELANTTGTATIIMPPGTYTLQSILPPIASGFYTVTLQGSGYGQGQTVIDGASGSNGAYGPLDLTNVNVYDLTIQNFQGAGGGANPYSASAVLNPPGSTSSLNYVVMLNNGPSSAGTGTSIVNYGTLYLSNVDISSNHRAFSAIIYQNVDINNPTDSGALYADSLTIHDSSAEHGIIVNQGGYVSLSNSTLGHNTESGNGILYNADVQLCPTCTVHVANTDVYNSTFAYNTSGDAAALTNVSATGYVAVDDSLIFGNGTNEPVCYGKITSYGHNMFDSTNTTGFCTVNGTVPCSPIGSTCNKMGICATTVCTTSTTGDMMTKTPMVSVGTGNAPVFHGGAGPVYMPLTGSPLLGHADQTGTSYDGRGAYRDNGNGASLPAIGAVQPTTAALVVHNSTGLTQGDLAIKAQMDTVFGSGSYNIQSETWNGTVSDNGLIVIAGSASSSKVSSHFLKSASGVVVLNQNVFNAMNMTASATNQGTTSATTLTYQYWDASGYIDCDIGYIDGTSNGNLMYPSSLPALTSNAQNYGWGTPTAAETYWGMPIPGQANEYGFIAYGYNQPMFNSFNSPADRWGMFANDAAAGALTTAGQALVRAIILAATNPRYW